MTLNLSTLYGSVGPTNTNIADAVAADSNMAATISANVPSASTIASAVTTAGNSAGWGATGFADSWTLLTNTSLGSSSSITLSWSGTYKKIIVIGVSITGSATTTLGFRLNGDTSSSYSFGLFNASTNNYQIQNSGWYGVSSTASGAPSFFRMTLDAPNSSSIKVMDWVGFSQNDGAPYLGNGFWNNTSSVTSFNIYTGNSATLNGNIYVYGVN